MLMSTRRAQYGFFFFFSVLGRVGRTHKSRGSQWSLCNFLSIGPLVQATEAIGSKTVPSMKPSRPLSWWQPTDRKFPKNGFLALARRRRRAKKFFSDTIWRHPPSIRHVPSVFLREVPVSPGIHYINYVIIIYLDYILWRMTVCFMTRGGNITRHNRHHEWKS